MPDAYADSSFLVSLYRRDSNQPTAERWMARRSAAEVGLSPLTRIELRHSLRRAASTAQINAAELRQALRQIDTDLGSGLLVHFGVNWTNAFRVADELSERHAAEGGQRAIDVLHVAIAVDQGLRIFLSFDLRQRRLAGAAGLVVQP